MLLLQPLPRHRSGAIPGRFVPTGARFELTDVRYTVTFAAVTSAKRFRTGESFDAIAAT